MDNANITLKKEGTFSGIPSHKIQVKEFQDLQIFCYRLALVTMEDVKAVYFGSEYIFKYSDAAKILEQLLKR